jgi:DNA polymerase
MVIGEAPGETEDEQGQPFIGRAGRFLDTLLQHASLQREEVFITNSVKCRPPDNRFPHVEELATCKELWLDRQLALIEPQIIVLLGKAPLKQVLDETGALKRLHGRVRQHHGRSYCIQYHPAAGLRSPDIRATMKQDFTALKKLVQQQQ